MKKVNLRSRLKPLKPTNRQHPPPRKGSAPHDRNRKSTSAESPSAEPARLQKVMAAAGLGSRRALETQISEGKVLVNGKLATLGQSLKPTDTVRFRDHDYRVESGAAEHRTLIYNKPEGELTTRSDPEGRPTVFDKLPEIKGARWVAVGRLDINTTGLLLLTTDGELANAMMHPSNQVDREYVCRIRGMVSDEQIQQLRDGVLLDDGPARFSDVQRMTSAGGNQWFQVTILEGRNREVRRLWEFLGFMVSRLKRVRYGGAKLPKGLKVSHWSEVSPRDHRVLREDVGLASRHGQLILQPVLARRPSEKPARTKRFSNQRNAPQRTVERPGSPAGSGRRQRGGKSGRR